MINRPVITKLWVNGRASEGGDEWTEEVGAHCERCYDDKEETSEVQAERILSQRRRGILVALQMTIAVGKVLRARGKMLRNKANGPADCLVTEMLLCLPTETVYEVAHWFERFRGECRAPEAWKVLRLVFLKKTDAKLGKGLRGFRAFALLGVFSKWCATVLVDMLHEDKEPSEWKRLHVGAERGVNCEHMQALVTNIFQRHWEWPEDRRADLRPGQIRYNTAFMASSDVKTAFDVARPAVVSKILTLTGVHGHLTAALLAGMQDVRGSASFENCATEFRYSRCVRQGGVEAPVLWERIAEYVLWKAEEKWRAKGWGLSFGRQHDNEHTLRGMMWADNYWLFSHSREELVCMVNDIIEELLDLDMEPKLDSLWGQARTNTRT